MDDALTTCPACGDSDPDCLVCLGAGEVRRGEWQPCPAEHEYLRTCRHCSGSGWVRTGALPYVLDYLADQAEAERMGARGLHVSGVPFRGEF